MTEERPKNRWAREPNPNVRKALKEQGGSRRNYWVVGKDGVRRGPAQLDRDGVRVMEERGAKCVPLVQGEFYQTELRSNDR